MSVFNKMLDRSEMAFEPFVTFISIDKLSILWQLLLESGDRFNHAATLCFNLPVVVIPIRSMGPCRCWLSASCLLRAHCMPIEDGSKTYQLFPAPNQWRKAADAIIWNRESKRRKNEKCKRQVGTKGKHYSREDKDQIPSVQQTLYYLELWANSFPLKKFSSK